jgi:hypothetical protein
MNTNTRKKIQQYMRQRSGINLCYSFPLVLNFCDIVETQLAVNARVKWLWERRNSEHMEVHCRTSIREAISVLRKINKSIKAEAVL